MKSMIMKSCVLCSVLLFMLFNAGTIDCSSILTNTFPSQSHHKAAGIIHAYSRKLLEFNMLLDYDYAGPNPKHEPRGKRGGGRNP